MEAVREVAVVQEAARVNPEERAWRCSSPLARMDPTLWYRPIASLEGAAATAAMAATAEPEVREVEVAAAAARVGPRGAPVSAARAAEGETVEMRAAAAAVAEVHPSASPVRVSTLRNTSRTIPSPSRTGPPPAVQVVRVD